MKHVPTAFWARWSDEVKAAAPGVMLLGEQLDGDPAAVARTWVDGHFSSMFDFPLAFAMNDVFCRGASPLKLAATLTNDRRYPDPAALVTLLDNHDLPRLMSVCGGDISKVKSALTFLLFARGIPSISWGTEVGFDGAKEPENRASMRFVEHPLRDHVAACLNERVRHPALREGVMVVLDAGPTGVAFMRVHDDQLALITVGEPRSRRPLPLEDAPFSRLGPPDDGLVKVSVTPISPGRYRSWRATAGAQVRGEKRVAITFTGVAGTSVVGSGPELGDWKPERSLALPVTLELPVGGVFEFKSLRRVKDGLRWNDGPNGVLFVERPTSIDVTAAP